MQKILYLHAGAEMYGADKVLLELIKGLDQDAFEAHVILPNDGVSFYSPSHGVTGPSVNRIRLWC